MFCPISIRSDSVLHTVHHRRTEEPQEDPSTIGMYEPVTLQFHIL